MEKLELDFYYGRESEQFTFYRLPKALITDERFKGVSNNAKLLYGLMLDRMSLSKKRGWLDEDNKVFIKYSLNNIEEDLNVSRKTAGNILKELEGIGLIEMVQQNGIANIIYVKNFVSEIHESAEKTRLSQDKWKKATGEEMPPVENMHQCNNDTSENITPVEKVNQCNDCTSEDMAPVQNLHQRNYDAATSVESGPVPGENLHPNNKESKNNLINNNLISQSYQQVDPMDEASAYMELIRENIEYDCMMSDRNWRDAEMYDELYQIICDVVFVKLVNELLDYGIYRYKTNVDNQKYGNTDLVLYQKYSKSDVCRLLNWDKNINAQNIGGYFYDEKTKTLPVYITYRKDAEIVDTQKYKDRFEGNAHFVSTSKPGRGLAGEKRKESSREVEYFYDPETKIYLFLQKDKKETDYYFMGELFVYGEPEQVHREETDDTVLEFRYHLDKPAREDLYDYFTNEDIALGEE